MNKNYLIASFIYSISLSLGIPIINLIVLSSHLMIYYKDNQKIWFLS
jgi:hypothetical protein